MASPSSRRLIAVAKNGATRMRYYPMTIGSHQEIVGFLHAIRSCGLMMVTAESTEWLVLDTPGRSDSPGTIGRWSFSDLGNSHWSPDRCAARNRRRPHHIPGSVHGKATSRHKDVVGRMVANVLMLAVPFSRGRIIVFELVPVHLEPARPFPMSDPSLWIQTELLLPAMPRGCHLVTAPIERALAATDFDTMRIGWLHVFLKHTSASLLINENADPDVRVDLEMALDRIAPETLPYRHTCEGPDDMPAHVKLALIGNSLTIPVTQGRLRLGTWQGIYLFEHRNRATQRAIVLTAHGTL